MAKEDLEAEDIGRKVLDLAKAMEKTRADQAERDDVVVEMKHIKSSRLELLAEDLAPVFKDIPKENDQFEFALTNGTTPRLWIDMTSFVRMAADGREYEFVKDTRLGRTVLGRTDKRDIIGERITAYVAERILERERMIEGDWIAAKQVVEAGNSETSEVEPTSPAPAEKSEHPVAAKSVGKSAALWFLLGIGAGLLVLWGMAETGQLEPTINWLRNLTA